MSLFWSKTVRFPTFFCQVLGLEVIAEKAVFFGNIVVGHSVLIFGWVLQLMSFFQKPWGVNTASSVHTGTIMIHDLGISGSPSIIVIWDITT